MNHHGGQITGDGFLDFSVNIPNFQYSESFQSLVMNCIQELNQYPEIDGISAREALSAYTGSDVDDIILGNGATELIYLMARGLKLQKVMLLQPTFTEYQRAFASVNTELLSHPYVEKQVEDTFSFECDLEALAKEINQTGCEALMICNPNNPTGSIFSCEALLHFLNHVSVSNFLLMIDESFIEFDESIQVMAPLLATQKVIVIRSMTKTYRVPGLRIGYMIGPKEIFKKLNGFKEPWTLNTIALKSIPYFLHETQYLEQLRLWCKTERHFLYEALKKMPLMKVYEGHANFILVVYQGEDPMRFREDIKLEKIHLRTCMDFDGLGERYYRIAVQDRETNAALIEKLNTILRRHNHEIQE